MKFIDLFVGDWNRSRKIDKQDVYAWVMLRRGDLT